MKKIAFIDHSFHKESHSTFFFIHILKSCYTVDVIWDDSWSDGEGLDFDQLEKGKYDIIVFFQVLSYPIAKINKLSCKNILFIPMYDNAGGFSNTFWLQYKDFRFINFSKTLHNRLLELGLHSLYIQYFLDPELYDNDCSNETELRGFLWQRTDQVTWDQIKILIDNADFSSFHIHGAVDPPGYELIIPSDAEMRRYSINFSEWFADRVDYLQIINDANVYFVPRLYEGIGMSFLEAMAKGQCVVAPNFPTMNEYIVNGETGLLYDHNNIEPLDFSKANEIGKNARTYATSGYKRWREQRKELLLYIDEAPQSAPAVKTFTENIKHKLIIAYFNVRHRRQKAGKI